MNDLAFADAARPAPAIVLRLELQPYSIGHELLLQQQRNPIIGPQETFVSIGRHEQMVSLISAVLICSRTWEENRRPHKWLKLWAWMIRGSNWALEIAEFKNYRLAGSTFPEILPVDAEEGRVLGAPFLARILNHVGQNFDCPLGLAQWLYFTHQESEGNCRIPNEVEIAADVLEKQILKENAEKRKVK